MRALVVATLLVLHAGAALAALHATATIDPARVVTAESADLSVAVEGSQSASTPELGDTQGLSVGYVGPATQMSFVNGKVTSSITHHFNVLGTKPGRYTIGPITVTVDGTRYDAGSVTLEIVAPNAAPTQSPTANGNDELGLAMSTPRATVYVGERLPLTVRLTVGAVRVTNVQYPTVPAEGFAIEKFPEPTQRRETSDRNIVQVVEFATALTPVKAGTFTVGPATMTLNLVVPTRRRGPFFGFFGDEARPLQLESKPLTLTVLPLPTEGRPPDFSGAVGRFTYETTASPTDVAAGDPVTVRSTVGGEGSLAGITMPAVAATDRIRVYPLQANPADGGTRTSEQVVIPLHDGALALQPPRFSYFDPAAHAYRIVTPPPIALTVRPSPVAGAPPEIVGGTATRAQPAEPRDTGARDIVFIKDAPGRLRALGARRYRSPWWWALQLVPVGLWLATSSWSRRRERLAGDVRYARFSRAGRAARDALGRARETIARGDVAAGHDAIVAAVRDYLAAKLDLPPGSIAEAAPARLRAAGVDGAVADEIARFFAGCEAVRFAPTVAANADVQGALAHADTIVRALEKSRRIVPAAALVLLVAAIASGSWAAGDEPGALFFRGNALYANEQYADAAAAYEKVLAAGVESGAVQFNLGNAYYKAGDLGRAILAYERASRLVPGDPDLAANLAIAREHAGTPVDPPLADLAFPLATRASTDALAAITAAAWWTFWMLLAAAPFVAVARRVAVVVGVAGLVVAVSAAYRWWTVDHPAWAVVVASAETSVRQEPKPTGGVIFAVKPGTVLRVERSGEWKGWTLVAERASRPGVHDNAGPRRGFIDASTLAAVDQS